MAAELDEMTQYDWFAHARVYENTGDTKKAIEAYEESLKIDPTFAKAWFYKGKLHYKLGEKDQARECVMRTLEIKPEWENHVKKYMPDL
ncbi:tetratricopeptide repeat protein [Candidatus Thorarchaeota archaeon]|nr:MAG: tetratricopeptide repeat protein [Candidatus Thorarchaeota archaeon]